MTSKELSNKIWVIIDQVCDENQVRLYKTIYGTRIGDVDNLLHIVDNHLFHDVKNEIMRGIEKLLEEQHDT